MAGIHRGDSRGGGHFLEGRHPIGPRPLIEEKLIGSLVIAAEQIEISIAIHIREGHPGGPAPPAINSPADRLGDIFKGKTAFVPVDFVGSGRAADHQIRQAIAREIADCDPTHHKTRMIEKTERVIVLHPRHHGHPGLGRRDGIKQLSGHSFGGRSEGL